MPEGQRVRDASQSLENADGVGWAKLGCDHPRTRHKHFGALMDGTMNARHLTTVFSGVLNQLLAGIY